MVGGVGTGAGGLDLGWPTGIIKNPAVAGQPGDSSKGWAVFCTGLILASQHLAELFITWSGQKRKESKAPSLAFNHV